MYIACSRSDKRAGAIRPIYLLGHEGNRGFAVSVNTSRNGVCIVTDQDFISGQIVVLYSKFLWPGKVQAEVIWCSDISKGIKKAGLAISHVS